MQQKAVISLLLSFLARLVVSAKNRNPHHPPHLKAHMFLFGNGDVSVSSGPNVFANNALPGRPFLTQEMGFNLADINDQKQVCYNYYIERFKIMTF